MRLAGDATAIHERNSKTTVDAVPASIAGYVQVMSEHSTRFCDLDATKPAAEVTDSAKRTVDGFLAQGQSRP
jgi:hypothetical protein